MLGRQRLFIRLVPSLLIALLLLITLAARSEAGSPRRVEMQDKCDPVTFNDEIGPGTCVGDEDVTFQEFIAELQKDQKVGSWRFAPDRFEVDEGETLQIINSGGETHTFSCVESFGGGFVPELNELSGTLTPARLCDGRLISDLPESEYGMLNFVPADGSMDLALPSGPGPHLFECLIHPWMRTTVTVDSER